MGRAIRDRRIRPLLILLLAVGPIWGGCVACAEGEKPASLVRDSAGVQIVETRRMAWEREPGWVISPAPTLEIGTREGEEPLQFFRVAGGRRLADGRIVVLNSGTRTIRIFSPDGHFLQEFGRAGEGPGEFLALSSLHLLRGDTLFVWDGYRRAFSLFTPAGQFVYSRRLDWAGPEQLHSIRPLPDGRIVAKTYAGPFTGGREAGPGIHRPAAPLLLFGPDGALLDTIGMFPNAESAVFELGGQPAFTPPPFDKNIFFDVRGSSIILGTAEAMEVSVWDMDGGPRAIYRYPNLDLTVRQGDRDWWRARYMESATTPEAVRETNALLDRLPFPETGAAFTALRVGPDGHVWLRTGRHLLYYGPSREWTILSPEGSFLGTISLPPNFFMLDIGPTEVIGVWRDELDTEFIRVYTLEKPGSPD